MQIIESAITFIPSRFKPSWCTRGLHVQKGIIVVLCVVIHLEVLVNGFRRRVTTPPQA